MNEQPSNGNIILYQTEDGKSRIEVTLCNDTVWLTADQMAELFQRNKSTISRHIKNVFEDGELNPDSVVAFFATTAADNKKYQVAYYNLDMIISVGYRVKSHRGVQFRIWATQVLREYLVKGFAMNDDLLKRAGGGNYFDELLSRIRDIRSSEKVFYRKILEIYALSIDYDPRTEATMQFFKTVQNKMHFSVHGHTAAEIIYERANAEKDFMEQTAGRDQLGDFAPKFAELNDDVLFGEVWSRTDKLGLRDRSLVTITSLISQGITDSSLTYHLQTAKQNGITRTEISEIITHIAFYAGWPKAWAAFRQAKEVWAEDVAGEEAKAAFQREMIFPTGEPNTTFAQYFIGQSYLAPVSKEQVPVFNVTFEPGCRNNWHIHRATKGGGQMLIGVAGRGWYQEEGKPAVQILPGTVIHIPAGVKHWHGAAADSWFAHLAFEVEGENTSNEWLEPVSDEEYSKLQ